MRKIDEIRRKAINEDAQKPKFQPAFNSKKLPPKRLKFSLNAITEDDNENQANTNYTFYGNGDSFLARLQEQAKRKDTQTEAEEEEVTPSRRLALKLSALPEEPGTPGTKDKKSPSTGNVALQVSINDLHPSPRVIGKHDQTFTQLAVIDEVPNSSNRE